MLGGALEEGSEVVERGLLGEGGRVGRERVDEFCVGSSVSHQGPTGDWQGRSVRLRLAWRSC